MDKGELIEALRGGLIPFVSHRGSIIILLICYT